MTRTRGLFCTLRRRSLERVAHLYEKLLLLKDGLQTEAAWRIAVKRHEFLEHFLEEWELRDA
jgi:uncharacterized protein